jgi:predicted metal-dependent enzyme (double-stranded beta helix superfamily)
MANDTDNHSRKLKTNDLLELIELIKTKKWDVKQLLTNYEGNDWKSITSKITNPDPILNGYHKYLFFKNADFEVYLITWFPLARSPIHNHPEKGCFVKILEGSLCEEVFLNKNENGNGLTVEKFNKKCLDSKSIVYRSGDYVLHRIQNETNNIATSIHVYFHQNFKLRTWEE